MPVDPTEPLDPQPLAQGLPRRLALVDDDEEFAQALASVLLQQGVQATWFRSSNDLLVHPAPYEFDFYLLDLLLPGVDGVELIRILRMRTSAGVLVVSARTGEDVFEEVVSAGADMYLSKPVRIEQIMIAIRAVHRRVSAVEKAVSSWVLDRRSSQLIAPDGVRIDLSDTDLAVVDCFVAANGGIVSRATLARRLNRPVSDEPDNALHASIYRLRRRVEKATPCLVPLQSQSGVGYVFRAPLRAI